MAECPHAFKFFTHLGRKFDDPEFSFSNNSRYKECDCSESLVKSTAYLFIRYFTEYMHYNQGGSDD